MAEVFLTLEENNNGKGSRKKSMKKKRQDKKPLLAGYNILIKETHYIQLIITPIS